MERLGQNASASIARHQFAQAEQACRAMERLDSFAPDPWVYRARMAQRQNDFYGAAAHARKALALAPRRLDVRLVAAESGIYTGDIAGTLKALNAIEKDACSDLPSLYQLCALYTQLGRHAAAYRCARRVRDMDPASLNHRYLLASAAIAVGKIGEAEALLDELVRAVPEEGDPYYNRAGLRKQTPERNHVAAIRQQLSKTPVQHQSYTPLCYALGKELEDLGDWDGSYAAIAKGAAARRARLAYKVEDDVRTADSIIRTFDQDWWNSTPAGENVPGPVFVLGLPRSGTTLVDRILSSHSEVASLGEVSDFAYAVIRAGFPARSKAELIARSATADMTALGAQVRAALRGYGEPEPFLIDKTPANYLYLGLIAKALPGARIIHVHRHPLASGYAMFKTLFRMGYPFSYDLEDIGRYYLAYHRLMAHWRALFGPRILDVSYERLVDDQEAVSRTILDHCGLEWQPQCLEFHRNAAPTATASATQVRQPIYRSARDLWRRHEASLQPLRAVLENGGVPCA